VEVCQRRQFPVLVSNVGPKRATPRRRPTADFFQPLILAGAFRLGYFQMRAIGDGHLACNVGRLHQDDLFPLPLIIPIQLVPTRPIN